MNRYKRPEKELDPLKKPDQIVNSIPNPGQGHRVTPPDVSKSQLKRLAHAPNPPDTLQHNIEQWKKYESERRAQDILDHLARLTSRAKKREESRKTGGCYPGCFYYTDSCFRDDCKEKK
jgi:hypothetical protein